jgi:hypothetical protein
MPTWFNFGSRLTVSPDYPVLAGFQVHFVHELADLKRSPAPEFLVKPGKAGGGQDQVPIRNWDGVAEGLSKEGWPVCIDPIPLAAMAVNVFLTKRGKGIGTLPEADIGAALIMRKRGRIQGRQTEKETSFGHHELQVQSPGQALEDKIVQVLKGIRG